MSLRYTTSAAELAFLDDGEGADDSLEAIDEVVDILEAVGETKEVRPLWDPEPLSQRYSTCAAELAFLATSAGARFGDEEEEEETDEVVDILEAVGEINEVGPK